MKTKSIRRHRENTSKILFCHKFIIIVIVVGIAN